MLSKLGAGNLIDLFSHLSEDIRFKGNPELPDELGYEDATVRLQEIAGKTNLLTSFVSDLLPVWKVHPIVHEVSQIAPLALPTPLTNRRGAKAL